MKTKTLEPKAAQLRRERLNRLIVACREKFSDEEIVDAFNYESNSEYAELDSDDMKNMLQEDDYLVFEDEDNLHRYLRKSAYMIFKPENLQQEMALTEFAEKLFPYVTDQQMCIL